VTDETEAISHVARPPPLIIGKSTISFHLALQNVTNEIVRTSNTEKILILELVTVNAHMEASGMTENVSNDSA